MFSLLIEKEPSEEDIGEEEVEEEEEEEQPPDEQTIFFTEEITECFALFDKNKTGTIDLKYLEKALSCLGISLTPTEVDEVAETLDSGGVVNFDNFLDYALEQLLKTDPVDALRLAFRTFDPENEGMLPSDRVKRWMMTLGDPLTEKEAKEMVKLGDPGGKGLIAINDISLVLCS